MEPYIKTFPSCEHVDKSKIEEDLEKKLKKLLGKTDEDQTDS
jgi:hypothetical protein